MTVIEVYSVEELLTGLEAVGPAELVLCADVASVPSIAFKAGKALRSSHGRCFALTFEPDQDGIELFGDNRISEVKLAVSVGRRAIYNSYTTEGLGTLTLKDVITTGQVQILVRDKVKAAHIEVLGLTVEAADTREQYERPSAYGVSVLQGAFTLWNMQPDANVVISADLTGISVGHAHAPVMGSGIFVSGHGDTGGSLRIERLLTGAVHSNGGIPQGTADQISGGVFIVFGTVVELVQNDEAVTTYGTNDMALDNWGTVDRWNAKGKVTTLGPSGIGFVNFGFLRHLRCDAPIETHGEGARGFNVYSGTVVRGEFDRVVTRGDGAVAVQISQPVGDLTFRRGIETFGSTGMSLVKGVLQELSAIGLSIKPGGVVRSIRIEGGLRTNGGNVLPLEQQGTIDFLSIAGGFESV